MFDWAGLVLICFVLPAVLSVVFCEILRKMGWIKENDLKMQQLSAEITRLRSANNRLRKQMDSNYGKIKGAEIKATQLFDRIVTKQR